MDLISPCKQPEHWTKYMEQLFSGSAQQAVQDRDPWEKGSKWSESWNCHNFPPKGDFQTARAGRENPDRTWTPC